VIQSAGRSAVDLQDSPQNEAIPRDLTAKTGQNARFLGFLFTDSAAVCTLSSEPLGCIYLIKNDLRVE
jgi:hypothetical protein